MTTSHSYDWDATIETTERPREAIHVVIMVISAALLEAIDRDGTRAV